MSDRDGDRRPLLSICIPTYNRAPWLRFTLALWVEQAAAFPDKCEIVISDNASPDETRQVVESLQGRAQVRYYCNETNIGGGRNIFKVANELPRGEFIWVAGDDDFPTPHAVERAIEAIEANPGLTYLNANYAVLVTNGPPADSQVTKLLDKAKPASPDFAPRRLEGVAEVAGKDIHCFTPIGASIFHRSIVRDAYKGHLAEVSFVDAQSVSSHALYVADKLQKMPAFYSGHPWLILSSDSTWPEFHPIFALKIHLDIMDRFVAGGADPERMKWARHQHLLTSYPFLVQMVTDPRVKHRELFSLSHFLWRNRQHPQVWTMLAKLAVLIPRHRLKMALRRI